jgi:triosephosphate isomerase (TIM)
VSRPRLVVGNWKMNPLTIEEAVALARSSRAIPHPGVNVGLAPPAIALPAVAETLRGSDVMAYAQDVHWEEKGAYTGQIAASMLRPFATGSIVGHSEVRRDQGDNDARVARKAEAALRHGLSVIYCLGESLEQRRRGETTTVLERQVRDGVGLIDRALLSGSAAYSHRVALAYEPIWAIGTGVHATAAQASDAIATLRGALGRLGAGLGDVVILYGGSVTAENASEFAHTDGVDGALVGGASLKAEDFAAIVASFA